MPWVVNSYEHFGWNRYSSHNSEGSLMFSFCFNHQPGYFGTKGHGHIDHMAYFLIWNTLDTYLLKSTRGTPTGMHVFAGFCWRIQEKSGMFAHATCCCRSLQTQVLQLQNLLFISSTTHRMWSLSSHVRRAQRFKQGFWSQPQLMLGASHAVIACAADSLL